MLEGRTKIAGRAMGSGTATPDAAHHRRRCGQLQGDERIVWAGRPMSARSFARRV